jgi:small conductance mechanosensitive channel
VKQALDEADISIPFPIRTLDFGIKGGEKLDAMISDKISQQSSNKGDADGSGSSQNE